MFTFLKAMMGSKFFVYFPIYSMTIFIIYKIIIFLLICIENKNSNEIKDVSIDDLLILKNPNILPEDFCIYYLLKLYKKNLIYINPSNSKILATDNTSSIILEDKIENNLYNLIKKKTITTKGITLNKIAVKLTNTKEPTNIRKIIEEKNQELSKKGLLLNKMQSLISKIRILTYLIVFLPALIRLLIGLLYNRIILFLLGIEVLVIFFIFLITEFKNQTKSGKKTIKYKENKFNDSFDIVQKNLEVSSINIDIDLICELYIFRGLKALTNIPELSLFAKELEKSISDSKSSSNNSSSSHSYSKKSNSSISDEYKNF